MTTKHFISVNGVETAVTVSSLGERTNVWGDNLAHFQFRVNLANKNGRTWFAFTDSHDNWRKGIDSLDESGVKNALYYFLSDGSCYSSCIDFADFCASFGYDEDSRKAFKIYKACQHHNKKARELFGDDYGNAMEALDC